MTSLYLSLTCHDKYTSPSWPSSLRSIVSDVTTYCLCLDMTYIIYISMQLITIKSIRNCDVSVFLFVLTWQIHQIHFDQAHQDQVYEMFGLPCICLYLDMTNTPSTFRSSSSRSKVSDVVTSGLVGHTVGIQKASSSQRIPTPQTILFLLFFFFKIWILFFFGGASQQILMQQPILFFRETCTCCIGKYMNSIRNWYPNTMIKKNTKDS